MPEKQKKFLEAMNDLLPNLSELDQERLLAFGEGLAFMSGRCAPPPAEKMGAGAAMAQEPA